MSPIGWYFAVWITLSFGIWVILIQQLRLLRRSITIATEQQLVQMILHGLFFFIEHPELGETDSEGDFDHFVAETGGWNRYFLRRNIISTLELLYFQRKAGAVERGFFVSHCNHIRSWFEDKNFTKTWEKTRYMHIAEFCTFVDELINNSAETVDPWRSDWQRLSDWFRVWRW